MNTYTEQELRELDAWIAEHVMGYHKQKFDNGYFRQNLLVPNEFRADKFRKHGWHESSELIDSSFPNYSTDPAAAMQVLEKCAEKISPQRLHIYAPTGACNIWLVSDCEGRRPIQSSGSGNTLPLAICEFANQLFSK